MYFLAQWYFFHVMAKFSMKRPPKLKLLRVATACDDDVFVSYKVCEFAKV